MEFHYEKMGKAMMQRGQSFQTLVIATLLFASCFNAEIKKTPQQFKNSVRVERSVYIQDSLQLTEILYDQLKMHKQAFSSDEYCDSTQIIVDSILYDISQNKIAVFVIAKNPSSRNKYLDTQEPFYFNASCYLGKRFSPNSNRFKLVNIGPFSLSNGEDITIAKQAIRYYYLLALPTVLDEDGKPFYDFNLDDKRFWNSKKGWERIDWENIN